MPNFVTVGVEKLIEQVNQACGDTHADWATIFSETYTDTLIHAVKADDRGRMFVLTGDIPAMWQRDSTAQMRPYLIPAQQDPVLADILEGVLMRQLFNMQLDPYANAFNQNANGAGHQADTTQMNPWVWERKYELDSLCYPAQFAYLFWRNTGRVSQFNTTFDQAIERMVAVIRQEQDHASSPYRFERHNGVASDTLYDGVGTPVGRTGMSWSGFRPSDDACRYGYLVPANLFAAATLRQLATVYRDVRHQPDKASDLSQLASELQAGVFEFGVTHNATGERIFAYEVDGLGNVLVMDDANVPSLLSLPYLNAVAISDPLYQATRRTILSTENRYYYAGSWGAGIGSPHTPANYYWPIAVAMVGLTQTSHEVKRQCLDQLAQTTAGTSRMHEGVDVNNPNNYTRPWFSWANMMFCELVLDYFGLRAKS